MQQPKNVMPAKAKFIHGLKLKKDERNVELTTAISMDNENQTKEKFKAFLVLVKNHNYEKGVITLIKVILSDWLQRHYFDDAEADEVGAERVKKEWLDENLTDISCFVKETGIKVEFVSWKELVGSAAFKKNDGAIAELLRTDIEFQKIVHKLSNEHAPKKDYESAKKYLLEECAVALMLEGRLAYPWKELNSAIQYVIQKFGAKLQYLGYTVFPDKKNEKNYSPPMLINSFGLLGNSEKLQGNQPEQIESIALCLYLANQLNKIGIYDNAQKVDFFSKTLQLLSAGGGLCENNEYGMEISRKNF